MTWFRKRQHPSDSVESGLSAEHFVRGSNERMRRLDEDLADGERERVWQAEADAAKRFLGPNEVAAADAMSDDEVERGLAQELRTMKTERPEEFRRMLANLPSDNQTEVEAIVKKYGI